MDQAKKSELYKEASYFSDLLLGIKPSQDMLEAYVMAHQKLPKNLWVNHESVVKIVEKRLDAVAIEFAARKTLKSLNLKLLLICYLAETYMYNSVKFGNDKDCKMFAVINLAKDIIMTPYYFLKGLILIRIYGLV